MPRKSAHRKALEKIAAAPSRFGFEEVIAIAIEPKLLERGSIYAEPDLVMTDKYGETYIVEYKGNGDEKGRKKAQEQLYNAAFWLGKYLGVNPKVSIIDGPTYRKIIGENSSERKNQKQKKRSLHRGPGKSRR